MLLFINSPLRLVRKMSVDLKALRMQYNSKKEVFREDSIKIKNPIIFFREWFQVALNTPEIIEPNAMCLSTIKNNSTPSSRYVLLKDIQDNGFTFFTNYASNKAVEIAQNPNVSAVFYWAPLRRSIRIEGKAGKIPFEDSQNYFSQRPRASQIGALASPQSQRIPNREYLDIKEAEIKSSLKPDDAVPMPNWGGYLIEPNLIEFWQGQTDRLHDRIRFRKYENNEKDVDNVLIHKGEDGWTYERLAP